MKKRGLAGLLALALILALAACGGTEAQEDAAQDQKMEEAAPPQRRKRLRKPMGRTASL